MKKLFLTTLVICASLAQLFAARQTPTTGRIIDDSGKGVDFATVILLAGEEQIYGTTTDAEGHFSLVAPSGHYTLTVQHLNYETTSKEIEMNDGIRLDNIVLIPSSNRIDAVVVSAQLIRREADRFIVDVANSTASLGKNGVELLERAPGVWITDDKISINGKSGSKVYINDREVKMSGEQLITYIKTLRAEEIQKIEVIPTSGADYDADSAGGIIKITLSLSRSCS